MVYNFLIFLVASFINPLEILEKLKWITAWKQEDTETFESKTVMSTSSIIQLSNQMRAAIFLVFFPQNMSNIILCIGKYIFVSLQQLSAPFLNAMSLL